MKMIVRTRKQLSALFKLPTGNRRSYLIDLYNMKQNVDIICNRINMYGYVFVHFFLCMLFTLV